MNDELLDRIEKRNQAKALKMIKALEQKIKKGQLKVMESGLWEGSNGKWNFHVVTRESDDFRAFTDI